MPLTAAEIAKADREYHPCRNGLHVCGQIYDDDGERPLTLANIPGVQRVQFEALSAVYGVPHEDADLVIDFIVDGDIVDDFSMRRQELEALLKSCQ